MNDYVSYTVIATGFDGANQSYSAKARQYNNKVKSKEDFRGGFNFLENPMKLIRKIWKFRTILRVKSPKSTLR